MFQSCLCLFISLYGTLFVFFHHSFYIYWNTSTNVYIFWKHSMRPILSYSHFSHMTNFTSCMLIFNFCFVLPFFSYQTWGLESSYLCVAKICSILLLSYMPTLIFYKSNLFLTNVIFQDFKIRTTRSYVALNK